MELVYLDLCNEYYETSSNNSCLILDFILIFNGLNNKKYWNNEIRGGWGLLIGKLGVTLKKQNESK
jgi:hypothetical protein